MAHAYNTAIASCPGRVCFAGEDIDWISGPSIVGAIDLRVKTTVTPLSQNAEFIVLRSGEPFNVEKRISLSNFGRYRKHVLDYVHAAVKVLIDKSGMFIPIQVDVESNLPASGGLSSSAAVSIATVTAVGRCFGISLCPSEICELAYSVENDELKTGAGQMDFYVCGLGGFMYINSSSTPPYPIEKYRFQADVAIVIADTQIRRSTAEIIQLKRQRLKESEPGILSYVRHTESSIDQMYSLLTKGSVDINKFGGLVSKCHLYLDKYMSVSTELLNLCVKTCLDHGALGAKLTGTGMGGCMFALVANTNISTIVKALSSYPVAVYVTKVTEEGVITHNSAHHFNKEAFH